MLGYPLGAMREWGWEHFGLTGRHRHNLEQGRCALHSSSTIAICMSLGTCPTHHEFQHRRDFASIAAPGVVNPRLLGESACFLEGLMSIPMQLGRHACPIVFPNGALPSRLYACLWREVVRFAHMRQAASALGAIWR